VFFFQQFDNARGSEHPRNDASNRLAAAQRAANALARHVPVSPLPTESKVVIRGP